MKRLNDILQIFETQLSDITIDSSSTTIQEFRYNELIAYSPEASTTTEKQSDSLSLKNSSEPPVCLYIFYHSFITRIFDIIFTGLNGFQVYYYGISKSEIIKIQ